MQHDGWRNQPQRLRERKFWQQIQGLGSRSHFDPAALLALLLALVLFAAVGFFAISALWRLGRFEAPLLEPVSDARILTNIREMQEQGAFTEAVFHAPKQHLLMAQEDGSIHRFNTRTQLWDQLPPLPEAVGSGIALMRSGCHDQTVDCADPDVLWVLSREGGLARFRDGAWQVLFGDQGFPVARDDTRLTHAAVSSDQDWLAVMADSGAIGLYQVNAHTWSQLKGSFAIQVADSAIENILWFKGWFWIGSSRGLYRFQPQTQELEQVPDVYGRVVSMSASESNGLWVLTEDLCYGGDEKCKRLVRFQGPAQVEVVLEESNRFNSFGLQDWHAVHELNDGFVFAGNGGLFVYDKRLRAISRVLERNVFATHQTSQGVFFGYDNGYGFIGGITGDPEELKLHNLPDEAIVQLLPNGPNEILALSKMGHVFAINPETTQSVSIFNPGQVTTDPTNIQHAVDLGDDVLFISKNNLLFHNWDERTYQEEAKVRMTPEMAFSDTQLLASGKFLFVRSRETVNSEKVAVMELDRLRKGVFRTTFERGFFGPIQQWWDWHSLGIGLIDAQGRVFRFNSGSVSEAISLNEKVPSGEQPRDAALFGNELALAFSNGIHYYNPKLRRWIYGEIDQARDAPVELASYSNGVLFRTRDRRLFHDPGAEQIKQQIGDTVGFSRGFDQLRDVIAVGPYLYFAFPGSVERYSSEARKIDLVWRLAGEPNLALHGVVNDEPLYLSDSEAYLGYRNLSSSAVQVTADDTNIWLVERGTYGPYLRAKPLNDKLSDTCIGRRPTPGGGATRIVDAVRVNDACYAVMTDTGLYFYNPQQRNWFETGPQFLRRDGRLLMMGTRLAIAQPAQKPTTLSLLETAELRLPEACLADRVDVSPSRVAVRAVSMGKDQVAAILDDGTVRTYGANSIQNVLPAEQSNAPEMAALRRMYPRLEIDNTVWFLGDQALHRYSFNTRLWQNLALIYPEANRLTENAVLLEESGRQIVIAKAVGGSHYWGLVNTSSGVVALNLLHRGSSAAAHVGDRLLDVQDRGDGVWTFVFEDRVAAFDPQVLDWQDSIALPNISGQPVYTKMAGRAVAMSQTGSVWWVGDRAGSVPGGFAAYRPVSSDQTALDGEGNIWRLTADGRLFRSAHPGRGSYSDFDLVSELPEPFDPERVQRAFRWRNLIIFDTDRGIRMYDTLQQRFLEKPAGTADYNRGIDIVRQEADGRLRITTVDQLVLFIQETAEGFAFEISEGPDLGFEGEVAESWETLKTFVVKTDSSNAVFDPIQSLTLDAAGQLMAQRPSGTTRLAERGALANQTLPPALNVGWLAWQRGTSRFVVQGPDGPITRDPQTVFRASKPWFADYEAVTASGSGFVAANREGLWYFEDREMRLDRRSVRHAPLPLNQPIRAFEQGFITSEGRYLNNQGVLGEPSRLVARIGDIKLRMQDRSIAMDTPLEKRERLQGRGFPWDRDRRALAFDGNGLMMVSNIGLHQALSLTGVQTTPLALNDLRRAYDGSLLAHTDLGWYRQDPDGWQKIDAPDENRLLIDDGQAVWRMVNGGLVVQTAAGEPIPLVNLRAGFALSSDVLTDVQVTEAGLFILSRAFVERFPLNATSYNRFGETFGVRGEADLQRTSNGDILLQREAEQSRVYRAGQWQLYQASDGRRLLAQMGPVRFLRDRNRVLAELQTENLIGQTSWQPFELVDDHFPFDLVDAIATKDDFLFVGTPVGLVVNDLKTRSFALDKMGRIYNIPKITRLARTAIDDDRLWLEAASGSFAIDNPQNAPIQAFDPPPVSRLRAETDLWRWQDVNGRLVGKYKLQGSFDEQPIQMRGGLFPHDRFRNVRAHKGYAYFLWERDWLSIYPGSRDDAANADHHLYLKDIKPQAIYHVAYDLTQGADRVKAGIYLLGDAARWFHVEHTGLTPINNPVQIQMLNERVRNGAFLERGAVRLVESKQKIKYQYQLYRQREWRSIPWKNGKLSLDFWMGLVNWRGREWAATPIGLAEFQRGPDGHVALGTALDLVDYPAGTSQDLQQVRFQVHDQALWVRFDGQSDQLYALEEGAQGVFQWRKLEATADPFVTETMVENTAEGWSWRRLARENGALGFIEGKLNGETVQVNRGRFAFDDVIDVAMFEEGRVEWVTAETGWFRMKLDGLAAHQQRRPQLEGIALDQVGALEISQREGQRVLVLRALSGEVYRLDRTGRIEQVSDARAFAGSDGFWNYWRNDGLLQIERETALGQTVTRELIKRRFSDDILKGLPVASGDSNFAVVTQAGLLGLANSFDKTSLALFAGQDEDRLALTRYEGGLAVASDEGLHSVDGEGTLLFGWPNSFNRKPLDIQRLPGDVWHIRAAEGWALVAQGPRLLGTTTALTNVTELPQFRALFSDTSDSWLQVDVDGDVLKWRFASQAREVQTQLPQGFQPRQVFPGAGHVYLLSGEDLYQLNVAEALEALSEPQPAQRAQH